MKYLSIEDPNNTYFLDIETDSLQPSKIWCCVVLCKGTRQVWRFVNDGSASIYHELRRFFNERLSATYIGHNIIGFDGPNLARLCGFDWPYFRTIDSLVCSYLYNPGIDGGHSLGAYGHRLGFPKGDYSDWTQFTPQMLEYCENDVLLTEKVYDALSAKMRKIGYSELSCYIEHNIRRVIDDQQRNGFWFDVERGKSLRDYLQRTQSDLAEPIQKLFPPTLEEMGRYTRRVRKDGSDYASYERHVNTYDRIADNEDGTYSVYSYTDFNIGSPKQRLERLVQLGYEAVNFTPKGNPKVDEESLLAFADKLTDGGTNKEAVVAMSEWLVLQGRITMLAGNPITGSKGWLGCVREDDRIHGSVMTCGATTRRMIHSNPNTANIPSAAKARYGKECRALWGVEPNKGLKLVGYDASGLETIGLLHYLENRTASEILSRAKPHDVHTMNSTALTEALGRPVDREWGAKTSWYAWLYGAYPPKLGWIVKGSPADGQIVIDTFYKNVPGLKKLKDRIENEYNNNDGVLRTIDGGFVRAPSIGSALNYKIQSLGAVVMKLASIRLEEMAKEKGVEFKLLGSIHDEGQLETNEGDADTVGKLAVKAISRAAEELNFREPLSGTYSIGNNWSETH